MNLFKNKYGKIYSGIKITFFIAFYFSIQFVFLLLLNQHSHNYYTYSILAKTISVLSLIIAFVLVYFLEKRYPRNYGIIISKKSFKHFLIGLLLGALAIIIIAMILFATNNAELIYRINKPKFTIEALYALIIFILVGIDEEVLIRGYVVHTLGRYNNKYVIYIIPAIIFSVLHLSNPSVSVIGLINIVIIGVLFTYMTLKTKNILMATGFHITWNFFQGGLFGFNVSGTTMWDSIYPVRIINNNILTGGDFGLEGGILTTLLAFIIILVVYILPVKE
ncbi:hypothetical protein SH1V18_39090 [Vallitalea longa]|uniref:CAAX prenyl protease 2/Lysostaphin resistance protein A-like domain-containing protein n=1 Tax=Vallitalea longa TaxID=2936439 RepID=A0A9W6DI16_9FIRM|nr:type II CAAX endopeptidase family protein [Vallitalea longa]GKX31429.1 hypothetical protein SH1V18_39090 [Vallitalea longa]